jgi:hypothetical protein
MEDYPDKATTPEAAPNRIAPFRFDVTPPLGDPLCGGLVKPVLAHDDSLEALGYVLLGAGAPIVVCAVDWTGILNEAHVAWRTALAEAAGTTPERVAVHCVHQHSAPFVCLDAGRETAKYPELPRMFEEGFFRACLDRARAAVTAALRQARPLTHVAHGEARVEKVASNRRVSRDVAGKIIIMRGSACKDPQLRDLPEGVIDPKLQTIAFYDGQTKVLACHYYATHPMSYYGDGRVTSDFCGLARKQRQRDEPECLHLYFTGCSGNIAAGKYNDGEPETRRLLTKRIYAGIVASECALRPEPLGPISWRTRAILPKPHPGPTLTELRAQIADPNNTPLERQRLTFRLGWLQRYERQTPVVLSALHLNDLSVLHLPAEPFIEYQLRAQQMRPDRHVAVAAYGDGGPWYMPVKEEYSCGGYEVSVAFCADEVDATLSAAMRTLLD